MNIIQNLFGQPIGLLFGLGAGLVIHAVLFLKQEVRHAQAEDASWEDGRRRGYHQCFTECVRPLEIRVEKLSGMECESEPLPRNMPALPERSTASANVRRGMAFQHTVNL